MLPQDSEWVRTSLSHNKGRSTAGSSLSSILSQQQHGLMSGVTANATISETAGQAAAEASCSWTQTPDEVEVVAPLPAGLGKKDVAVKFAASTLEVFFLAFLLLLFSFFLSTMLLIF